MVKSRSSTRLEDSGIKSENSIYMYIFNKTRLKLTVWYLLIIMLISISFSIIIYKGLENEVERFARIHRMRIERQVPLILPPPLSPADLDLVKESKQRIILILAIVNGGIFVISGALGYFLAGKTLEPIRDMVDEQNRFVSDASHELRTPLTSLKTSMEVHLRDKNLSLVDVKSLISESINDVDRLQLLCEELLKMTQYQTPEGNTKFEEVNIGNVVKKAVSNISPLAKRKKIPITVHAQDQTIRGNKNALMDLLVILLDNAIKYSLKNKPVTVSVKKTDSHILISVHDRGIGIEKKDIPYIFDRFYRADSARSTTVAGGYGLGLSIAKKIAEIHHGSIRVESEAGTGSTFTVRLPLSFS